VRSARLYLWALALPALAAGVVACKHQTGPQPQVSEEPPLLLEDEEPSKKLPPAKGPVADNSRCHVCHINYEDEKLAVIHARANVGCEKCHGASDAHCSDEDNITPPEIMVPRAKIIPSCMTCHPKTKIDIKSHKELLAGGSKKVCTDCHGKHRMGHRTRRWDKATGKLIKDDKVRMIRETPKTH